MLPSTYFNVYNDTIIMKITMKDPFTGKFNTMELDISFHDYASWKYGGKLIQDAMPNLTPSEREFIKTGITDESWNKMFGNNNNFDVMNEVGETGWTQD